MGGILGALAGAALLYIAYRRRRRRHGGAFKVRGFPGRRERGGTELTLASEGSTALANPLLPDTAGGRCEHVTMKTMVQPQTVEVSSDASSKIGGDGGTMETLLHSSQAAQFCQKHVSDERCCAFESLTE